uniref:Protein YLS9-like n=1 Tax=Nicotiana tabacum TaxID=4097 RepID=A0A1S3ZFG5_TOBAC|nr:PREDICTED: uncharacterized protein LOC107786152 [Nicotiana tabacum]XP_016463090.1 PREDICTED: uncharacterized protein LOC107786152 [Nicotiana tabacum]XP_016463091.1 PREDICTED: uncharacterized protein LOC107786152 [Nicotiana tabacum]
MDYSKDIENQQKTVMVYPSMARHNEISHKQAAIFPSSYDNNSNVLHPPSYIMPAQGYPSNYNPNSYPLGADATFYVNYSQKYMPLQEENNSRASFGRYMTTMMLILIIGMIMFSLVIWLLFGTEKPEFHLVSIQVSSLMITSTSILGNWQVNVSMKNSNNDLDIKLNTGKTAILYKTNVLAETPVDPFNLASQSSAILFSNLTTSPGTFLDKGILSEATGERDNGVLKFTLQIYLGFQYTSKTESKNERLRIYCNDVKVQFGHGPQDKGELTKADPIDCLIYS